MKKKKRGRKEEEKRSPSISRTLQDAKLQASFFIIPLWTLLHPISSSGYFSSSVPLFSLPFQCAGAGDIRDVGAFLR